jgi:ketosteroid isomerase-like protein
MSEVRKELARRFLDGLTRQDRDLSRTIVRDDVRWWVPPSVEARGFSRPMVGWGAIPWLGGEGFNSPFRQGTTNPTFHHVVAEGDLVAVHMNLKALTDNGPYDNEYHWLFRFDGDLIAEVWEILDTAHATNLLGALAENLLTEDAAQ